MEKTYKEYLEEILCSKISDDLTGDQKQALDSVIELLGFCDYERLCELAKADKEGRCSVIHAQWVIDRENSFEKIAHCSHCGKRPVSTEPQEALKILADLFLDNNWYVNFPLGVKQVNTLIVDEILYKYSRQYRKAVKKYEKELRKRK